ncbi:MAG: lipopolysaccharide biosynthesis protein [Prevotella sp.]|nr:lipopolysaccharide biosynthesis protein [Prevotella sp.]
MSESTVNNKRIAKNTVLLYVRTLLVMPISLYTSRVILKALGVEDYGIFQVIGGLVAMFSILSNALSTAISRFITYEIGKGDKERLGLIFSSSRIIQLGLSVVVVIAAEIIGVWFLENKMQIPQGREIAAHWVLQCTLVIFCLNLISVPYNACIIAHEHMQAFAYISIFEALARLGVCYLIIKSPFDRLIYYAVLLTILAFIIRLVYAIYCHRHFEESRAKLCFEKNIFKEMAGFAGWSFFSNSATLFNSQGVNMLINVFFGVTANAARGLANQVEHAVLQFINNFTVAINPQITKSYANREMDAMFLLVCRGAKFSFLAMLFFALPLIFETETILNIWLTTVPPNTLAFVRLSLILGLLDCLGKSSFTACIATGRLKKYALVITSVAILEFPLTWLFFAMGFSVIYAYYIYIFVKAGVLMTRLYMMKTMLGFKPMKFVKEVYMRIIPISVLSILPMAFIVNVCEESFIRLILSVVIGVLTVSFFTYIMGLTQSERKAITKKLDVIRTKI